MRPSISMRTTRRSALSSTVPEVGAYRVRRRAACRKETQIAECDGGEFFCVGAGFGDDGILRPVEVDFAEPTLLGYECRQRCRRLIDDVCLIAVVRWC